MQKENKIIISVIAIAFILFVGWQTGFFAKVFSSGGLTTIPEGIILFYGQGCPHCKIIDDFIAQNNIAEKVKFANMEVWYNKDNQTILTKAAQKCGINSNELGVPFLYDGDSKCYVGQDDVINFFKDATGIQ